MRNILIFLIAGLIVSITAAQATTLPPELKAYDFAEAYTFTHGGLIVSSYHHGFSSDGKKVKDGVLLRPGDHFIQYNPNRMTLQQYTFVRMNSTQAFFHERIYRYHTEQLAHGKYRHVRDQLLDTDDFYLTKDRALEPVDHVFTNIELHPGEQEWRTRL